MNHSMAKTFVGTPEYYAPEVNPRDRSGGTYTQAADCWSCGISLYVMLVGQFPGKVASDGVSVYFDPEIMKHLSPSAVTLLKQMLATDPAVRINVQQALNSDWLLEALPTVPTPAPAASAFTAHASAGKSADSLGSSGVVDLDLTKTPHGSGQQHVNDPHSNKLVATSAGAGRATLSPHSEGRSSQGGSSSDGSDAVITTNYYRNAAENLGTAVAHHPRISNGNDDDQVLIMTVGAPSEKRKKRDSGPCCAVLLLAATQPQTDQVCPGV
mgnify:CR=1 FL=1